MLIYKVNGYKQILKCSLEYAQWLVTTGRIVGGVYLQPGNQIYL
jgi:hypothetical protein